MRIRILVEDCPAARDTLRRRAAKHEWDTWDTVDVKLKNGKTPSAFIKEVE